MEIAVCADRLDDAGLEGLVVSSVTFCSLTTARTSVRYLPLKAIFASCPSTRHQFLRYLRQLFGFGGNNDLARRQFAARSHNQAHNTLPSRAKMEAILQALRKSATEQWRARRSSAESIVNTWERALNQLRNELGFLHVEHDLALIGLTVISTVSSSSAISRLSSFNVRRIMTSAFSLTFAASGIR